MARLSIVPTTIGDLQGLQLSGDIDEDTVLETVALPSATEFAIDLSHVTSINSCGVREWLAWIKKISSDKKIKYVKCPRSFVEQINMVHGFCPDGVDVDSFYVPYYCEKCDRSSEILIQKGKEFDKASLKLPENVQCQKCSSDTVLDVIESEYFRFLR